MIALAPRDLDEDSLEGLLALQRAIDAGPDYAARVEHAKDSWKRKPKRLFDGLKDLLASMCSGNRRCVYCEDSLADEIEHMRLKDLFPDQAYAWTNYVLACGPCNGPKNNRFALLYDGSLKDVTRKRGDPVSPPAPGRNALLDPRVEDPVDFLWLDFRTWRYVPNADDDSSVAWIRAQYTIDVLRLNKRDDLVRGRKSAFSNYESRVTRWLEERTHWNDVDKASFVDDFRAERFRGVWERMKRYRNSGRLAEESGPDHRRGARGAWVVTELRAPPRLSASASCGPRRDAGRRRNALSAVEVLDEFLRVCVEGA